MSVGVTKDYKLKVRNLRASHTLGFLFAGEAFPHEFFFLFLGPHFETFFF
jgi:hypothetical protein